MIPAGKMLHRKKKNAQYPWDKDIGELNISD